MLSVSCIICSSGKRDDLIRDQILPSTRRQGFEEVLIVGPYSHLHKPQYARHVNVAQIWNSTVDGLAQREAGAAASRGKVLFYMCDDHKLHTEDFGELLRTRYDNLGWDVLVPSRVTCREGRVIQLNTGMQPEIYGGDTYCGGHAGLFRREALRAVPWLTAPHAACWDVTHSKLLKQAGAVFAFAPELIVEDIEPNAQPWK